MDKIQFSLTQYSPKNGVRFNILKPELYNTIHTTSSFYCLWVTCYRRWAVCYSAILFRSHHVF